MSESEKCLNLMIVGDGTVGKTCILYAFYHGKFIEQHNATIFDTQNMTIEVDDITHRIKLHDTAGQEEFENLRKAFMKNKKPDVFILCYSVDSRRSFENITNNWIKEIRNRAPVVLVATKTDLRKSLDQISSYEGKSLCQQIGAKAFVECSSLNLQNVNEVFFQAIRAAISTDDSSSSWITKYCTIS